MTIPDALEHFPPKTLSRESYAMTPIIASLPVILTLMLRK